MSDEHKEFEAHIEALCQQGKSNQAATKVIEHYGSALLRFLVSMCQGNAQTGEDVFQVVCVKLWECLPSFQWGEGSLRAWAFVIARRTLLNYHRDHQRKREDQLADKVLSVPARLSRTLTQEWRKTEVKSKLWASIDKLPPNDRALFELRLHQKMRWTEIARVLHEDTEIVDAASIKRSAAGARKRYERLKTTLRDQMKVAP